MGPFDCSPNGANFFSMPDPTNGAMYDGLVLNVLRSLQFSYMLMKGFRSTSRALRDLDMFRDEDMGGRSRGRPAGCLGGGGGRGGGSIGTGSRTTTRVGMGRCSAGRLRGGVRMGRREVGRPARCTGDNPGNRAKGEGNRVSAGNGESKIRTGPQDGKGDCQTGHLNGAGNAAEPIIPEGANGGLVSEGSNTSGSLTVGESRVPAESVLIGKLGSGMTNRTLSVAGLGAVYTFTNNLQPMKGFMKSVKMATGVVSGVKTATGVIQKFQAPAGGVLIGFGAANGVVLGFETARMIVKGAKISKDFAGVWKSTRTRVGLQKAADTSATGAKAFKERFFKGLKVSDGALNLMKLTKDFGLGVGGSLQDGFTSWDLVTKSYDASNSLVKVLEGAVGLKGGGVIGLAGKGFTALKGAVSGLGLSVKLVKAVVISKEVSIILLKGFGLSKTIMGAFKAFKEGKKMVNWLIYRKEGTGEVLLETRRVALLKGGADYRTFELLMTCVDEPTLCRQDAPNALMFSLASLLLVRWEASDTVHRHEDGVSCSPSYIFSLSLPS